MKKFSNAIGGLLGALRRGRARTETPSAASLSARAGSAFGAEAAFEQLEQRQLLFGLTVTPTPGTVLPDSGGWVVPGTVINPVFTLTGQTTLAYAPGTGAGTMSATFGYMIPFLLREVPDFVTPATVDENFDDVNGGNPVVLPVNLQTQAGGVIIGGSNLSIVYTGIPAVFPAGAATPQLVPPPPPAAGTSQGLALQFDLFSTAVSAGGATDPAETSPFIRLGFDAGNNQLRWMLAFQFETYSNALNGGNDINLAANQSLIRVFRQGLDVTNQVLIQRAVVAPATDPATVRTLITQVDFNNPVFFDEVVFVRAATAAVNTVDRVLMDNITGFFPGARFQQFNDDRVFGAQAQMDAILRYGLEQMSGAAPTVNGSNTDFAPIARLGVSSFLRVTAGPGGGAAPTVVGGGVGQAGGGNGLQVVLPAAAGGNPGAFTSYSYRSAAAGNAARVMTMFGFVTSNAAGQALGDGTSMQFLRNGVVVPVFVDLLGTTQTTLNSDIIQQAQFRRTVGTNFQYMFNIEGGFDEVRIFRQDGSAGTDTIVMDDIVAFFPQVYFQDLYGRGMRGTLALGSTDTSGVSLVDLNDDGVPEFNDGIGRIDFFGSTATTNLTLVGGLVAFNSETGAFEFAFPDSLLGLFGAFTDAGFGFIVNDNGDGVLGMPPGTGSVIIGAPFFRTNVATPGATAAQNYHGDAPGGLAVGQAQGRLNFTTTRLRNNGAAAPAATPQTLQGVFAQTFDGQVQNVGVVNIHGVLFGSSEFSGSVQRFGVGYLPGSVAIQGDAGLVSIATDAGFWLRDDRPGNNDVRPGGIFNQTGNQLTIGRTLGELQIGGRNAMTVQVLGDVNNDNRPRIDYLNYSEREVVFGIDPNTPNPIPAIYGAVVGASATGAFFFGANLYRNDILAGAEFVGSGLRGVIITGSVGAQDPDTAEDPSDTYAFAAARGQQVVVNAVFTPPPAPPSQGATRVYARIVDINGRVLATHQMPLVSDSRLPANQVSVRFTFTPTRTDIYYLVVGTQVDGTFNSTQAYTVTMSGQLPVSVGAYTTGAGSRGNLFQVQSGDVGLVRIGNGIVGPDGEQATGPGALGIFTYEAGADIFDVRGSVANPAGFALQAAGNVYGIVAGGDWAAGTALIGGNLGGFYTGAFGTGIGDFLAGALSVGGVVGVIDIAGSIGYTTQATALRATGPGGANSVVFSTGTAGGGAPGHIGALLAGGLLNGQAFVLNTSANSIVDRFIIGNRPGVGGQNNGRVILRQPVLNLGAGSELRFVDFSRFTFSAPGSGNPNENVFTELRYGVPLDVTDDNGVTIRLLITGGAGINAQTSIGQVLIMPGPQGASVGRLTVTLNAGAELHIIGLTSGRAAVGNIIVTTDGGTRQSSVIIEGSGQIDVWRLTHNVNNAGGNGAIVGLAAIINNTTDGDIVAMDVTAVTRIIVRGSIGRTETNGVGDDLIGPFLGLVLGDAGQNNQTGGPIALPVNAFGSASDGGQFVPVNWTASENEDRTLEDIGAPGSGYLNGVVVRRGNVQEINVRAVLGDVYMQDFGAPNLGNIDTIIINSDNISVLGRFEGVAGVIFVNNLRLIDVGDGIAGPGNSPFAQAGIFALDDIDTVQAGSRVRNPQIRGIIIAADRFAVGTAGETGAQGINRVIINGGIVDGAFIASATFDSWWRSARYGEARDTDVGDPSVSFGTVNNVTVTNANFTRSTIFGRFINTVKVTGGAWDASTAEARGVVGGGVNNGNINSIIADSFVNSTLAGEPLDFRYNSIIASGNLATLQTNFNPVTGNISDLFLTINGNVTGGVRATNIVRLNANVTGTINALEARADIRSSTITAGRLTLAAANANIRASTFIISGIISQIRAGTDITDTSITADGPNGRVDKVLAGRDMVNITIISSGLVGQIQATLGNLSGLIRTTDATDGSLTSLRSGRNLEITLDVDRDVGTVIAGGNIGRRLLDGTTPDAFDIFGNLGTMTAGGQIYADLRVGQSVTGTITIGRVFALPNPSPNPNNEDRDRVSDATITVFGRINAIVITGDYAGSITSYSGGIGSITINAGSFRRFAPGVVGGTANRIEVHDGNLGTLTINRGHLLGDVMVFDGSITTLRVNGDAVFGNIGIDPTLSAVSAAGIPAAEFRNQLPPGVDPSVVIGNGTVDGPTIFATLDINAVIVGGGIFETSIIAGRRIGTVTVTRGIDHLVGVTATPTVIVAGDRIDAITVGTGLAVGVAQSTFIGAGITSLGVDNRPGGLGANADTVHQGSIGTLTFRGNADSLTIVAGMIAGTVDGLYNNGADDRVANGLSTITSVTVTGLATNNLILRDTGAVTASPNLLAGSNTVAGTGIVPADPRVFVGALPGDAVAIIGATPVTIGVDAATITFSGPGTAFYSPAALGAPTIILQGTTSASNLTVAAAAGIVLANLVIVSGDDASLGTLSIPNALGGLPSMYIDGNINNANFTGGINAATPAANIFEAGGAITNFTAGPANALTDGTAVNNFSVVAASIGTLRINGGFGSTGSGSTIRAFTLGTLDVRGPMQGSMLVQRDVGAFKVSGALSNTSVAVGGTITSFSVGSVFNAVIAAANGFGAISVTGNVDQSLFLGGVNLGADGVLGGGNDTLSNGNIGNVSIGGNFTRSDIGAGVLRGADGYFGTGDDLAADGRSSIGNTVITGGSVGSAFGSESFRIISNGTAGTLKIAGQQIFQSVGNFAQQKLIDQPTPIQVTDLRVTEAARRYTAVITFNQAIDPTSIAAALSIAEIRGVEGGLTTIPLVVGTDYVFTYNAATFQIVIEFSQTVTSRDLPANADPALEVPGAAAGPGVYRFTILATGANRLRSQVANSVLDGDNNSIAGDDFAGDQVVGDAGDRFFSGRATSGLLTVDYYAAVNLDLLLNRNNSNPNTPDTNSPFTIRGTIGDHPDTDITLFNVGGDVDAYRVTLRAGQVLRLGVVSGPAPLVSRLVLGPDGLPVDGTTQVIGLRGDLGNPGAVSTEQVFLIQTTGVYTIVVGTAALVGTAGAPGTAVAVPAVPIDPVRPPTNPMALQVRNDPAAVPPLPPPGSIRHSILNGAPSVGQTGAYAFTVTVADDGDTGFSGAAPNAGSNTIDPNYDAPSLPVPLPAAFVPAGGGFTPIVIVGINGSNFTYNLNAGSDGVQNTPDDIVIGSNGTGMLSMRLAGLDRIFGTADDVIDLRGTGTRVLSTTGPNAIPLPSDFFGTDATPNTPDDRRFIAVAGWNFFLERGPNGIFNGNGAAGAPSDDVVVAVDQFGTRLYRTAGADGIFNASDPVTVQTSIGDPRFAGAPGFIQADTDIFTLNNGATIAANTRFRVTLRSTEFGTNLGLLQPQPFNFANLTVSQIDDLRSFTQFSIFDRTTTNTTSDGLVVAAPSGVQGYAPRINQIIASNGVSSYGFDSRGDFYMDFVMPPNQSNVAVNGVFSLMVQGMLRGNYAVEIQDLGALVAPPAARTQNFLIETRGASVNWLDPAGLPTTLAAFDTIVNGFTGRIGLQTINDYIINGNGGLQPGLIASLRAIFNAIPGFTADTTIRISTNPADFLGQQFSTIFITSTFEPTSLFNNGQFGRVERVDPFNANVRDQGVVFLPALNVLGNAPTQAGIDAFTRQLTAIVARQMGQLMGIPISVPGGNLGGPTINVMANNSQATDPGAAGFYRFNDAVVGLNRATAAGAANGLATQTFFLGNLNPQDMLRRFFWTTP